MIWNPFKTKKSLGIDIGTSSIKIIEISQAGGKRKLENFGDLLISTLEEKSFRTFKKNSLFLSSIGVAQAIQEILQEAEIKTNLVNFSIPDFSTFFTSFELPPMPKEEISRAVSYAARQHIPLPLTEVTLDWQIIEGEPLKKTKTRVLLVSVANQIISQYQKISEKVNLKLSHMEAEAFALNRALIKEEDKDKAVVLVDIGAMSTTINVIDRNILKSSYSVDIAGNEFTSAIAKSLNIDYNEAEKIKKKYGFMSEIRQGKEFTKEIAEEINKALAPLFDLILVEIKKISQNIGQIEEIDKYILAGGSALLPGLRDYYFQQLGKKTIVANPFSDISYPPVLDKTIQEIGPSFATAVGLALRGTK